MMTVAKAFAGPELTFILQALAAEEKVTKKQIDLIFRRGDTKMQYIIRRNLPDRLYMYRRNNNQEQELYIIGDRIYQKNQGEWDHTPAIAQLSIPFSIVSLFEQRLENIREQNPVSQDGVEQRVFVGTISWFAGRSQNEGEIQIFIDTEQILPRSIKFKGLCGASKCAFEQVINYDPAIVIEAPVP